MVIYSYWVQQVLCKFKCCCWKNRFLSVSVSKFGVRRGQSS